MIRVSHQETENKHDIHYPREFRLEYNLIFFYDDIVSYDMKCIIRKP
jgi:hypothetical protein